jgi:hypothetical protein
MADKDIKLQGFKFYVCGLENTGITLVKQYTSQIPPIPRTYRESDAFFYEDLSSFILKSIGNDVVKLVSGSSGPLPVESMPISVLKVGS